MLFAFTAVVFSTVRGLPDPFAGEFGPDVAPYGSLIVVGVCLVFSTMFGWAGLATIFRWRGWRIWAGAIAWLAIMMLVFDLFAEKQAQPGEYDLPVRLIFWVVAVFVLIAKRLERRPDFAAVFDD
jgi:hypothetical protein